MAGMMPDSFSARLPLSRSGVDRDYLARATPGLLDELRADAATRALLLSRGQALLSSTDPVALDLVPFADVPRAETAVYLGRIAEDALVDSGIVGSGVVAVVLSDEQADAIQADRGSWGDLRRIGAELSALDAGLFTQALAITNFHASHTFSPRTGEATVPAKGGWVRHPDGHDEESSGQHIFPRTDPAIIVGVLDDQDRLLLGANALWGGDRYSLLAGFVEPGESLEAAVIREINEEAGIVVVDPVYLGSQPWPFPASIMIGFSARLAPGSPDAVPDGEEIIDLRWFTRHDLSDGVRTIGIPGRASIARAIIEQWFGGPLDAP
ncbi:NAD(+) diphosphatase [Naasia lichenicola]|uniref:NAD(+) diphosphatase n=1 Tax=Naasia lichenicola TaxID=2565933 RepID=A0A4S4FET0_9MICO|nr:NAD(+) diphosphatase [Naasia lichenicola]THG28498.1 NAD(+) diphosphatase [Naasia lichenicola]